MRNELSKVLPLSLIVAVVALGAGVAYFWPGGETAAGGLTREHEAEEPAKLSSTELAAAAEQAPGERAEVEAANANEPAAAEQAAEARPPRAAAAEGGTISVTVLDAAGAPLSDASVRVREVTADRMANLNGGRLETTNAEGVAEVDSLEWRSYRAMAQAEGRAPGFSQVVKLSEAEPSARVVLQLGQGGRVVGRLLDVRRKPAAGIRLSIHLREFPGQVQRQSPSVMASSDTDSDGEFEFDNLAPGSYALYTRAKGEDKERVPDRSISLEVLEGQTTQVEFEDLSASFVKVSGRVTINGEPAAGTRLSFNWADRSRGYLGKNAKTGEDGAFAITLDEPGAYRVQVTQRLGSFFREFSVPAAETHEVELAFHTGSISGTVRSALGAPVGGFPLRAIGRSEDEAGGSMVSSTSTNEEGDFEFPHLLPGTYSIRASEDTRRLSDRGPRAAPHLGSVSVERLALAANERLRDVELKLSAAGALELRVLDSKRAPVASAAIHCRRIRGEFQPGPEAPVSDAEGVHLWGGLDEGEYLVSATLDTATSTWERVQVRSNETREVELVLERGTVVHARWVQDGSSAEGIYLSLYSADDVHLDFGRQKEGGCDFGPLSPGTYLLVGSGRGEGSVPVRHEFTVQGEESLLVEVDLR